MQRSKFLKLLSFLLFLSILNISCDYNPLGGKNSYIDGGNTPFLLSPYPFSFDGVLAKDGEVVLTWSESKFADDYSVVYGTSPNDFSLQASGCTAIKIRTCTIGSLTNGTTYYFKVIARNIYGKLGIKKNVALTPNPFHLKLANATNAVYISWPDKDGALGTSTYTLQYGTSPGVTSTIVPNITNGYLLQNLVDGQNYYLTVTISNTAGTITSFESSILVIAPPGTPTWNGTATVNTSTILVSWNAASGAGNIKYTVLRTLTPGDPYSASEVAGCINITTLSCTDSATGLIPGNHYYYLVYATNEGGNSPNSSKLDVVTVPKVPANLIVQVETSSSNKLLWARAEGNADIDFEIYRSTTTPVVLNPSNKIGTVNSTFLSPNNSYIDSATFNENTIYYYTVIAKNGSVSSAPAIESDLPSELLTAPSVINFPSVTSDAINLTWNFVTGNAPVIYNLYRSLQSNPVSWDGPIYTGSNAFFKDPNVNQNTQYYYKVSVKNLRQGAVSQFSNEYSVVTGLSAAPILQVPTQITSSSVRLNWDLLQGNGAVTYELYRATNSTGPWGSAIFSNNSATTFQDNGLNENTIYYYKITATNNAPGATAISSDAVQATTANATPPSFILPIANITADSAQISWNAAPNNGKTIYKLYRSTTGTAGSWSSPIYEGTLTTVTDNNNGVGLSENTDYFYKLELTNDSKGAVILESTPVTITTNFKNAPTITTSDVGVNSLNIQWSKMNGTGAVTYNIYRSTATPVDTSGTPICTNLTLTYTCTDSTVQSSSRYYYAVKATNSTSSISATSSPVVTLPSTPNAPTVTAIDGKVTITWAQSPGTGDTSLISYIVQRSRLIGSGYQDVMGCANVSSASLTCTENVGPVDGNPYYYTVRAKTLTGLSAAASTPSAVTPITPIVAVNVTVTPTQITLSWSGGIGRTTQTVYSSTTAVGSAPGNGGSSTGCVTSPCNFPATSGQIIYYTIVASNANASTTSNEYVAVVHPSPLTKLEALDGAIKISWSAVAQATNYKIYFSDVSGQAVSGNQLGCDAGLSLNCTISGLINGQTYYFALVITRSVGGDFIGTEDAAVPIGKFDITQLVATGSSSAEITWSQSLGATSYDISYGTSSENYTTTLPTVSANVALPYAISGLKVGETFYFMVTAKNAYGSVRANQEKVLQTQAGVPTGLKITAATSTSLTLNWSTTGNPPVTYKVYRANGVGAQFVPNPSTPVCTVLSTASPSNACIDTGLQPNTAYYYVITATNSQGESDYSPVIDGVTALSALPTFDAATNVTDTSLTINWNALSGNGVVSYDLNRSLTGANGSWTTALNAAPKTALSFADSGLTENTTYYYRLIATNNSINTASVTSANFSVTTNLKTIPIITNPAVSVTPSSLILNWTHPGVNSSNLVYRVYRSATGLNNSWGSPINTPTLNVKTFSDTGLSANTKYYYKVTASNDGGVTEIASNNYDVTTALLTIPKFVDSETLVTTTTASLTWTQAEGGEPVTYKLYRSTTAGSWGTPILTSPTALTYTDSGLTPNTKYFYKITITNNAPGATELSSSAYEVITDLLANPTFAATSSITATSMTINWNAYPVLGATVTFKLYRSETGNGSDWVGPINTPSSSTSYNDTGLKQNTKYYYLLKANNNSLTASERSSVSNLQQTTQISEKPILTTINTTTSDATLQWENIKGNWNVTYSVYRSTSLPVSTSGAAVCTNPSANTCTDNALSPGNIYYYVLVANNTVNQTVSDPITITTTPPAPPAPTAVAVGAVVTLTLSPVTGVANPSAITYTVQRKLAVGGTFSDVPGYSAVTASSLTVTDFLGVVDGVTSYVYRVIANLAGASSSQPSATATVTPIAVFPNPTLSSTATTITLSWVTPAGAATFEVYTSTVAGNSNPTTGGVLVPSCTSSPCTFPVGTLGQTVYYSVLAQNTTTNGVAKRKSNEVFVTPIQVNDIQVIAANSKATIQWSLVADPNITNYTVYYATTAGGSLTSGKTLGCNAGLTATCDVTGLTNGQKYYFSLFVTRPIGGNFQSSEVSGTPVGNFAINSVTTTTSSATLTWQKSVGATKYKVSFGTQSGVYTSETIVNSTGAATESYTITGLNSGVLYYFYVSAQNADNGSVGATEEKLDVTVPISPNNFKVSQTDYNSVSLEFSNDYISVPLIYKIYRGASATFNVTDSGVVEVCAIPVTSSAQAVLNCKDENSPAVSENKIYYYRAVANTNPINGVSAKTSTPSSVVSGVTQFNAASTFAVAVKAGTLSAQSVTLTWTFDVGTEKIDYDVFQSSTANAIASGALISCTPVLSSALPSATNQCVVNGLSENQRYYFAVRAKNGAPSGRPIISSDVLVVTQFSTTTFPVTLSSVNDVSATLNWTFHIGSSNVDFVISSVVGGTSTALLAAQIATCTLTNLAPSSTERSCNITGLSQNTNYKFTVQAVNKSTPTASTLTSSGVDVITAFAPAATFAISVTTVNSGDASIQWTLGIGNSSVDYTVNINNVDISATNITGCTLTAQAPSATLNCKVSGLTLNTSQVISVKAKNGSIGTNSQITSNSVTAVTPFAAATSFTITNSNLTHNSVTLSWVLNVGSAGITYSITEANSLTFSQSCSLTSIPPANTITCNITGLTENTNYTFNVTATGQATFPLVTGKKTILIASAVLTKPFTAPTGLTATITGSGPSAIQLNWNLSSGSGLTYTVFVAESPTAVTTTSEKFCTNITLSTCSNTQYAGAALTTGKTYQFIVVSENASGQSNASAVASVLFSPPINLTVPTITGTIPASGIMQNSGTALTGGFGSWENTGAACTYRWYRNGLGITTGPNVTGTISAASPSTNYTTQPDDKCRVITFGVSCTNGLGTTNVFSAGLNSTFGINTQNIVNEYSTRVGPSVTATGSSQIKGFLDSLIAKSIPLPDYFYAMRSYQNAATGTKLYDLYCPAQDASSIVYNTWDTRGILNTNIASQIATVPNVFSGKPSTIAAIAATPVFASSFRGVSGYAGSDPNVNTSFGYANVANALNVGSGIETSSVKSVPLLLPGLYDYFGFYSSSPNYGLKFANSFAQPAAAKATFNATGGLILGAYNNNPIFLNNGLNSFMPFAAAWTSTALTFPQQEDVRKAYYPTMGVGLHKFVYVITWEPNSTDKDSLHRCALNIFDGSIQSCSVVVAPFDYGTTVYVQQIGQVKKIYFSLYMGKIYLCSLDEINGTVSSGSAIADCPLIRNASGTELRGLAIYARTTPSIPTNMYITNDSGKKIYNCSLNPDGTIVTTPACLETSTSSFTGKLLGATVFQNYLYVGTQSGEALVCPINTSNGNLGTCTRTASTNATGNSSFAAIGYARSIKFYDTGSTVFAYISNRSSNEIYRCTWNSSNGFLHTCSTVSAGTLQFPSGLFISKSLDNVARIYITNIKIGATGPYNPYLVICQINNLTGSLGACATTQTNPTPFGIQSAEDIYIQDF
ncbi:fibronectin type III domain-containing protein [Spirobacillus cienkowskii]|uniref:fibronectin type III domain-containing protein n=1 Tax=Spirobacillus cienkowskii TaxID=495820 RepID=UPI0030D0B70C